MNANLTEIQPGPLPVLGTVQAFAEKRELDDAVCLVGMEAARLGRLREGGAGP